VEDALALVHSHGRQKSPPQACPFRIACNFAALPSQHFHDYGLTEGVRPRRHKRALCCELARSPVQEVRSEGSGQLCTYLHRQHDLLCFKQALLHPQQARINDLQLGPESLNGVCVLQPQGCHFLVTAHTEFQSGESHHNRKVNISLKWA
jgi:hypothetical protein